MMHRASAAARLGLLLCGFTMTGLAAGVSAEQVLEDVRPGLTDVEGTRTDARDEEPRVLNIVPWQPPTPAPGGVEALTLPESGTVLRPLDLEMMETHRHFRETLDVPGVDSDADRP